MLLSKYIIQFLLIVAFLPYASVTQAVSQGTIGASSNGKLNITVNIRPFIVTYARKDSSMVADLKNYTGGNIALDSDFYIAQNSEGGRNVTPRPDVAYSIIVQGSGDGINKNGFGLSNGNRFLSYRAFYNDDNNLNGRVQLTSGRVLQAQKSTAIDNDANTFNWLNSSGRVSKENSDIQARPNANISIIIPESEISKAAATTYIGTLTILIQPI